MKTPFPAMSSNRDKKVAGEVYVRRRTELALPAVLCRSAGNGPEIHAPRSEKCERRERPASAQAFRRKLDVRGSPRFPDLPWTLWHTLSAGLLSLAANSPFVMWGLMKADWLTRSAHLRSALPSQASVSTGVATTASRSARITRDTGRACVFVSGWTLLSNVWRYRCSNNLALLNRRLQPTLHNVGREYSWRSVQGKREDSLSPKNN